MNTNETTQPESYIVNVTHTNEGEDSQKRRRFEFVFSSDATDLHGNPRNEVDDLIAALESFRGKRVKLDFRIKESTTKSGVTFPSSFLLVKEVIPRDKGTKTYVSKGSKAKSQAASVKAALG